MSEWKQVSGTKTTTEKKESPKHKKNTKPVKEENEVKNAKVVSRKEYDEKKHSVALGHLADKQSMMLRTTYERIKELEKELELACQKEKELELANQKIEKLEKEIEQLRRENQELKKKNEKPIVIGSVEATPSTSDLSLDELNEKLGSMTISDSKSDDN